MKNYIIFYLKSDEAKNNLSTDYFLFSSIEIPSHSVLFETAQSEVSKRYKLIGITGVTEVSKEEMKKWKTK